ncbi:MBL fold metallo-hydrolase [Amycolatopsis pigmentata]|uniref:MBL fold metallo-hydrolase n=1 Tax=Amycolatopsis pigmentata TaxID=450801 RepID=A0ABW5G833_9PSEU
MNPAILLGWVEAIRVLELQLSTRPPEQMFPELEPTVWQTHAPWLAPHHWDPASGLLRSSMQTWILRTGGRTVLVDTGVGNHKSRPGSPAFDHLDTGFLEALRAAGVTPEDVTDVVNTHLHADHVGWNTRLEGDGWVPTFPNATYLVAAADYAFWHPDAPPRQRTAAANENVFADSVLPIERAGLLRRWDGGHRIDGGLSLELAPGHTPGSAVLMVESGSDRAVFVGDLLHNPVQFVEPGLNSCFCEDPAEARATRRRVLEWAADNRALVFPAHVGGGLAAEISRSGSKFAITNWKFPA